MSRPCEEEANEASRAIMQYGKLAGHKTGPADSRCGGYAASLSLSNLPQLQLQLPAATYAASSKEGTH